MHGAYDTLSKAQQTLHDYSVQRNALRSTPSSLEAQVCCVYAYVCLWRVCVCVCVRRAATRAILRVLTQHPRCCALRKRANRVIYLL